MFRKVKVKAVLVDKDLWNFVRLEKAKYADSIVIMKGKKGSQSVEEAEQDWDLKQEKALAIIQLMVTDHVLIKITAAKTATQALQILDDEYESRTGVNKLLLKQQLYSTKLDESQEVESYVSKLDQILQQLGAVGCKIEEEDAALALLLGLPPSWANFKTAICIQAESKGLKLGTVKAAIRTESLTRKATDQIGDSREAAFYVGQAGKFRRDTPQCERCGRTGHIGNLCRTKCFKCHEVGHLERNCKKGKEVSSKEVPF